MVLLFDHVSRELIEPAESLTYKWHGVSNGYLHFDLAPLLWPRTMRHSDSTWKYPENWPRREFCYSKTILSDPTLCARSYIPHISLISLLAACPLDCPQLGRFIFKLNAQIGTENNYGWVTIHGCVRRWNSQYAESTYLNLINVKPKFELGYLIAELPRIAMPDVPMAGYSFGRTLLIFCEAGLVISCEETCNRLIFRTAWPSESFRPDQLALRCRGSSVWVVSVWSCWFVQNGIGPHGAICEQGQIQGVFHEEFQEG